MQLPPGFAGEPTVQDINDFRSRKAIIMESIVNWLGGEIGMKETCVDLTLDPWLVGPGIVQVGFAPEDSSEALTQPNAFVKPGLPYITRVDPQDILVPFGSRRTTDMRWIARRFLRRKSDVEDDTRLKLQRGDEARTATDADESPGDSFLQDVREHGDLVEYWEFHDAKYGSVCCVSARDNYYLRESVPDPDQVDGLGFVDLQWSRDPRVFWTQPLSLVLEPLQVEMNTLTTQIRELRSVQLLRLLYNRGQVDQTAIDKIMSGVPFIAVDCSGPPANQFMELKPNFPQVLLLLKEALRQDMRELMGISRIEMGETTQGRKTATEVKRVQVAHQKRVSRMRDAMADNIMNSYRKVCQLIVKNMPQRIIPVIGSDATLAFMKTTGTELADEYDLTIDVEE